MSKLPDSLTWSEAAASILNETDKTSCKAVITTIGKAAEAKETKEAAMAAFATWRGASPRAPCGSSRTS